jgi:hypothetical protein
VPEQDSLSHRSVTASFNLMKADGTNGNGAAKVRGQVNDKVPATLDAMLM